MPKLPVVSGEKVLKALGQMGFVFIRGRGSHCVLKITSAKGDVVCVVPMHKQLAAGTLKGILRQARVEVDVFLSAL